MKVGTSFFNLAKFIHPFVALRLATSESSSHSCNSLVLDWIDWGSILWWFFPSSLIHGQSGSAPDSCVLRPQTVISWLSWIKVRELRTTTNRGKMCRQLSWLCCLAGKAILGLLDKQPEGQVTHNCTTCAQMALRGCEYLGQAIPRQRLWHPALARELARVEEFGALANLKRCHKHLNQTKTD